MDITLWTQDGDFSSQEHGRVTLEDASRIIRSFPWDEKLQQMTRRLDNGEDACPPGVGLNCDHEVLHVFTAACDELTVHLSLKRPGGYLGFIPKPNGTIEGEVSSIEDVIPLVELFFGDDRERLAAEARRIVR